MNSKNLFIGPLVFFSGFCSLVYQIVWDRALRYNFGGDNVSSAIMSGTFLLGLGLGAYFFKNYKSEGYKIYALVELFIGIFGIFSFGFLSEISIHMANFFPTPIEQIESLRYPLVFSCLLFLLPPCILMGGTLPLMFNCFIQQEDEKNSSTWIYALNTLGASFGVLLTVYFLFSYLSLSTILKIIGLTNIAVAVGIFSFGKKYGVAHSAPKSENSSPTSYTLLLLAFLSGFLTIAFEIILFRFSSAVNSASPYNYPVVLFFVLLSIAMGSFVFARKNFKNKEEGYQTLFRLFFISIAILIVSSFISWNLINYYQPKTKGGTPLLLICSMLLSLSLPFFMGGIFPNLIKIASFDYQDLPKKTGLLYLLNSLGSFVGAFATQFIGFWALGTPGIFKVICFLGFLAALFCLLQGPRISKRVGLSFLMLFIFATSMVPSQIWDIFRFAHHLYPAGLRDVVEGETGISTVEWWNAERSAGAVRVNTVYMAELPFSKRHLEQLSPIYRLEKRKHVLILGLGGANFVRELVKDPNVDRIEVVDWSFELPKLLTMPAASKALENCLDNPKVKIVKADARVAVSLYPENTFDVVLDNLAFTTWAGATNIKSQKYFSEIKRILKPSGAFIYGANYAGARLANLSALARNFSFLYENAGFEVVVATNQAKNNLGEQFILVDPTVSEYPPIVDDLLIYEFKIFQSKNIINKLYNLN
jgi:spermidine synthase